MNRRKLFGGLALLLFPTAAIASKPKVNRDAKILSYKPLGNVWYHPHCPIVMNHQDQSRYNRYTRQMKDALR